MADDAAIVKQESAPPATVSPLDQVAAGLSTLKLKDDPLLAISSKSLGDVLPLKFYEGASGLELSEAERSTLMRLQDTPDDDVEIRPDGLVYAEHIHARRALTELFGASWALLPGSAITPEKDGDRVTIFQRWVLVVRGKYVGEAIGAGAFYANNAKMNKSDAAESAQSEALRRICAKSALGIGSNVWDRRFAREWRREHAIQVWVTRNNQREKQWRRKDDDPFETEIGPVAKDTEKGKLDAKADKSRSGNTSQSGKTDGQESGKAPLHSANVHSEGISGGPERRGNEVPDDTRTDPPPKVQAQPMTSEPATPAAATAPTEKMADEGNFRLFMLNARRAKLVAGEDSTQAIAFICEAIGCAAPTPNSGESGLGILRRLFMGLTFRQFNDVLMPKLREKG